MGLIYRKPAHDSKDFISQLGLSRGDKISIETNLQNRQKSRKDEMEM